MEFENFEWENGGAMVPVEYRNVIAPDVYIGEGAMLSPPRGDLRIVRIDGAVIHSGALVYGGKIMGGTIYGTATVSGGSVFGGHVHGQMRGGIILDGGVVHPGEIVCSGVVRSPDHVVIGMDADGATWSANKIGLECREWIIYIQPRSGLPDEFHAAGAPYEAMKRLHPESSAQDRVLVSALEELDASL